MSTGRLDRRICLDLHGLLGIMLVFFGLYSVKAEQSTAVGAILKYLGVVGGFLCGLVVIPSAWWNHRMLRPAIFLTDLTLITAGLYITQGFDSDLYLVYFLVIFMVGLGQSVWSSMLVALVASAVYLVGTMKSMETQELASSILLMRLPFFFVTALICSYFSSEIRDEQSRREHDLAVAAATEAVKVQAFEAARLELEKGVADRTIELEHMIVRLKSLQGQLISAEKMSAIGRLAAGLSHELRTPLGTILLNIQLLQRSLGIKDHQAEESIKDIEAASMTCNALVNSMLTFSRQTPFQPSACHLHSLLEQALDVSGAMIQTIGITIQKSFDSRVTDIPGDPAKLTQVFVNLARNAIEAMPRGGTLSLETERVTMNDKIPMTVLLASSEHLPRARGVLDSATGRDALAQSADTWVVIRINDTGMGISQVDLPQVFEPFFTRKPVGQGTGLGLAICYEIVAQHGGILWVESDGVDKGARFQMALPIAGASAPCSS